jgi:tRNA acetyltransferase TAN1
VCGVSVVGSDFDKLKRYNLAEIFEPTPRPEPAAKEG